MLQNIKQFFERHILSTGADPGVVEQRAVQIATAALLVEVMHAKGELQEAEQRAVRTALRQQFQLSEEETESLLRLAQAAADAATDDYRFTALINEHFSAGQKEQVVECLWRVAAADHQIDSLERTLVYKIADLLYVPRFAQIKARERALRAAVQGAK
jgi:uncharacterized tellurite resistance protein B-like protein